MSRPMISFMISVVPPYIVCTRVSVNARATRYSAIYPYPPWSCRQRSISPLSVARLAFLFPPRLRPASNSPCVEREHRLVGVRLGDVDLGGNLGEVETNMLEGGEWPFPCGSLATVIDGEIEDRPWRRRLPWRSRQAARGASDSIKYYQAHSFFAQQVGGRRHSGHR